MVLLDISYWNVPTEDLVPLFEEMGVKTGIDLDKLLDCVKLAEKMVGLALPGHLLRAGKASQIAEIPKYLAKNTFSISNPFVSGKNKKPSAEAMIFRRGSQ